MHLWIRAHTAASAWNNELGSGWFLLLGVTWIYCQYIWVWPFIWFNICTHTHTYIYVCIYIYTYIFHKHRAPRWTILFPSTHLSPRQNGRHFPDDVFKCIFVKENVWISIKISLKFVPKGPITNVPALVQIMVWHRPDDKLLSLQIYRYITYNHKCMDLISNCNHTFFYQDHHCF